MSDQTGPNPAACTLLLLSAALLATATPRAQQANPFLGAWNITGTGQDSANVYWLEIRDDGGKLSGLFLNRTGHPLPLAVVKVEHGELIFQGGTSGKPTGPEYHAKVDGGRLVGSHTVRQRMPGAPDAGRGHRSPRRCAPVNWVGVRPPRGLRPTRTASTSTARRSRSTTRR